MVARRILVPPVRVRIFPRQLILKDKQLTQLLILLYRRHLDPKRLLLILII